MKIFYVIREGWNAANQSSAGTPRKPRNDFDSNRLRLMAVIQAETPEEAVKKAKVSAYANQIVYAVSNPRSVNGLTAEIRKANQ